MIELSAICVAGGAGLLLGDALVAPGERTRRDALVANGREAIRLVLGLIPVLIVAGLVEGFISPSDAYPPWSKAAVGISLGIVMWAWLLLGGRNADDEAHGIRSAPR